jgi:hypothetical protein
MAAVTIARRLKRLDVPACRFRASDEVAIHVSARLGVELPGCPVVFGKCSWSAKCCQTTTLRAFCAPRTKTPVVEPCPEEAARPPNQ